VSDGTLNVQFQNGSVNNAKVCAIEILAGGSSARLAGAEVSAEAVHRVQAYPNPTSAGVTIAGVNPRCADFKVTVLQGTAELRLPVEITSESQVQLGLGQLPAGLYVVRIQQCGRSVTEKVIVTR
ncbi:T9SS type A sorting domain-containing protein, partial [Larkinella insperata]